MKSLICTFFLLCAATTAFSQNAPVLQSTVVPMVMIDHPQHASQHAMAKESTLLDTSVYSYAQGEVPLVELGSLPYEIPLGDIARSVRKEHAVSAVPKATKILEN
jgi:hypothetical protein